MEYKDHAKWLFEVSQEYLSGQCDEKKLKMIVKIINEKINEIKEEK